MTPVWQICGVDPRHSSSPQLPLKPNCSVQVKVVDRRLEEAVALDELTGYLLSILGRPQSIS
jgi:hypothetical protein